MTIGVRRRDRDGGRSGGGGGGLQYCGVVHIDAHVQ